ncbi:MAG: succinate dehydrogenase [Xanthobacteraceae bacterium]
MNVRLYLWQRLTAALMLPLAVVHVAVIFYATQRGLSAADLLARTQGSVMWGGFYTLFVLAIAIHAAIGIHNIVSEWTPLPRRTTGILATAFGFALLLLGLRAVAAVVLV